MEYLTYLIAIVIINIFPIGFIVQAIVPKNSDLQQKEKRALFSKEIWFDLSTEVADLLKLYLSLYILKNQLFTTELMLATLFLVLFGLYALNPLYKNRQKLSFIIYLIFISTINISLVIPYILGTVVVLAILPYYCFAVSFNAILLSIWALLLGLYPQDLFLAVVLGFIIVISYFSRLRLFFIGQEESIIEQFQKNRSR